MDKGRKVAVVTGGSSGIGYEFSKILTAKGWDVVMVSNSGSQLSEAAESIKQRFGKLPYTLCLDLGATDSALSLENWLKEKRLVPHLLINNAGIFDFCTADKLTEERIRVYVNLHILTTTLLTRNISKIMAVNGVKGYILNMSSMSCWMPMGGLALYSATKAYIRVMSRSIGVELADKGISVTVACPGGIATGLFGLSPKYLKLGVRLGVLTSPEKFADRALKKTFRRKCQYINGFLNRIAIPAVSVIPFSLRRKLKSKLLDSNKRMMR